MKKRTLYPLLRKEISESIKTHRLLIIIVTFLFFGMLSPLTALYMPDLMKSIGTRQGMIIELNEPQALDSLMQFHKNIAQAALFIMIFIVMGMMALEKERGTAAFLLVKPVSRDNFVLAKYLVLAGQILVGMGTAAVVCGGYTFVLFNTVPVQALVTMSLYLSIYLMVILSITLLLSTLFSKQILAGVGTFVIWLILEGLAALPRLGTFLPGGISVEAHAAAAGMTPSSTPLLMAAVMVLVCMAASIVSFRQWEA